MHDLEYVFRYACEGQRTTLGSQFSPLWFLEFALQSVGMHSYLTWVLGTGGGLSARAVHALRHLVISLAHTVGKLDSA